LSQRIVGIDEAGRGSLAGPVVAAAVIFLDGIVDLEVKDSKQISAARREMLALNIRKTAFDWSIGAATAKEIDELNIHRATLLAMRRAVLGLRVCIDYAYVDGKFFPDIQCPGEQRVRGDETTPVISAASILAKVSRDQQMIFLNRLYPAYGFAKHKGYPTLQHRSALAKFGPSSEHRLSFRWCLPGQSKLVSRAS